MKKKYVYSKCSKCGVDKKPTGCGWCNKCHNEMRKANGRPKYIYTKCCKCKSDKKPNGCGWCSKCNIEYRRTLPKQPSLRMLVKELELKINCLEKEIALLKPKPIEPKFIKSEPIKISEPIIKFEHPRLKILLERMKNLHTYTELKTDKLKRLIEPIINRNHYACFQELILIMEYHDTLLKYEINGNIYKKYLDLCLLHKYTINKPQ